MAIINSRILEEAVAGLMSKGQFGSRDLHKHLWRLPIPAYDPSTMLHREIATAAMRVVADAAEVLSQVRTDRATVGKVTSTTVVRREIRAWLATSDESQDLERAVTQLLA